MADDRHDPNAPDPSEHVPEEELVPEDDTVIGRAFRWSLLGIAVVILIVVALFVMNRRTPDEVETVERNPVEAPPPLNQPAGEATEAVFRDVTAVAGIDFVHVNGATGEKLLP